MAASPGSAQGALAELVYRACVDSDWQLSSKDIAVWSTELRATSVDLMRELALELAERFVSDEVSYEIADDLANALLGAATHDVEDAVSDPEFWAVYEAFDEGGYARDGREDEDPVETYTRPHLRDALESSGRWPVRALQPMRRVNSDVPLAEELGLDLTTAGRPPGKV